MNARKLQMFLIDNYDDDKSRASDTAYTDESEAVHFKLNRFTLKERTLDVGFDGNSESFMNVYDLMRLLNAKSFSSFTVEGKDVKKLKMKEKRLVVII
jgi:hypothetical protein